MEADKDWMMIRMVGGWVFLLVPAHPGSPGQRAVEQLLLLLLLLLFVLTEADYGNDNSHNCHFAYFVLLHHWNTNYITNMPQKW